MSIDLYARLRAQCCEISGLSRAELDAHARKVEQVVNQARLRKARPGSAHTAKRARDRASTKGR